MMAIQTNPMESALSFALDPPKRPWRLSRNSTIAVSVVALLHVGLGAYLYTMKMNPPREAADPPGIIITTTKLPPPPPKPVEQHKVQQQAQPPIHHPTMVDPTSIVKPVELLPPPLTHTDPGATILPQPPADPGPPLIQNPDWISRPTGLQMTRYYPETAMENGVSGKVVLTCGVTASGGVAGCQVMSETPAGQGFAAAALKLATFFRMSPAPRTARPSTEPLCAYRWCSTPGIEASAAPSFRAICLGWRRAWSF
jgi:protein TonB